ncbi:MAG TPA: competence/damage-inducible protein A [Solirubrobacterales bacterium]|nr:competence/damage-inducible protein A [Solirubrobacterales bacterium]
MSERESGERGTGVRAGILVTGTEVLSGYVTDRNGPWLSERLADLGVEVEEITVVGDRPEDLEGALRHMRDQGLDLIVTSGGLGPTADDLTAEVVGRFAGRQLVLDEEMEKKIGEIIARYARRLRFDPEAVREANRKQAMVPEGATALDPAGTAPGLVVPADGQVVIVLPGPPRELQEMWPRALDAAPAREVLDRTEPFQTMSIRMFGIPESELAKALREIQEDGAELDQLEVTTCLRGGELVTDVRSRPGSDAAAETLRSGLEQRLGRFTYTETGESIEEVVFRLLGDRTIAVAESESGGLLAARLTLRPGSSKWFAGGVVSYSNDSKAELLGVDPSRIEKHGAASPEVAEAMADGALARFDADVACSTTGIAGPDGGTEEKPVGYVCFCAKTADGQRLPRDIVMPGSRNDVRERSVVVALHLVRYLLEGREPPR